MYYSEMSGPTGTTSTVLQQANNAKKATESKAADGAKAAATTADAATPAKSASPAYTISQSMENLLDSLSGKKPAAAGGDGANADAAGDAAAGGKTGSQAMADRAKQAEQIMQKALEQSKGLSGLFEKAIDNMAGDLGSLLGGLGMSDDDVKGAVGDFGSAMKDKLKSMDFSQMGMSMEEARSQWSIESRGMELTIQDGDKSVRISFAKSTLDFTREDRGLAATLNADGSGSAMFSAATTKVSGKATGMIVRANGFSDDEIKGVLEKLNGMAAKGGMNGLGALTPTKSADGVMHLNLDLSQPIAGLTDGSSAKGAAAADASQKVDIKA
ncbi:hypothetical protein Sp245p_12930 [Azospirillum baldaniorum]|uniref:Uncharacterized protein n=1 Tax=Azospirillum baldaniorum TaxID=1064539 RepID=A0A9P1NLI4_9PROT|nr:hypothetical protein [Azospirillum baldaniorum]AWJ90626.1 hypothetical protein Sp245p_12930 [Azospirillum baldaniorum]TWA69433.1 hypothetical protein FBZ84_103146 [Azospirillum baldaniorum]TWA78843.1 hypothetical protein FBZ85_105147 [Azospirillum brasilense]CCC97178.1 conserved protein of unknown function [Azospirillum baldaniorum]